MNRFSVAPDVRRALLFLGVTGLVIGAWQGPQLWERLYPPVKEYCQMYLANRSAWEIALPILGTLMAVLVGSSLIRLVLQLRGSRHLERTVAAKAVPIPARLSRLTGERGIRSPVTCIGEAAPLAFCYGFRTVRICVSQGLMDLLTDKELEAVLVHEDVHAVRRHPLRALLAKTVAGMLFLLPLARWAEERYLLSLELRADGTAARAVSKPHLAAALLKLLQAPSPAPVYQGVTALNPTEERIRRLTEAKHSPALLPTRLHFWRYAVLTVVVGVLAAGAIGGTSQVLASGPGCRGVLV